MKTVLKIIISAAIIAVLAYKINWVEFGHIAAGARGDILFLSAVIMFAENMVVAWRWKMLLEPVGVMATFMEAFRSYLKGNFIAYFVPAAVTADVVKAVDFNRSRSRGVEVVSSIFLERGFGAMAVSVMVVVGLLISPLINDQMGLSHKLIVAALALIVCCIAALFADKFFFLIPESWLARWPKIAEGFHRAKESFRSYRRRPGILVGAMILSLTIQVMRVVPVFLIGLAIGAGSKFYPYLISVPVIYLLNMLPVVGSRIGTEQGMFVLLLGMSGITAEQSMAVALLSLVLGLITALPGGYWLLEGRKAPAIKGEFNEG